MANALLVLAEALDAGIILLDRPIGEGLSPLGVVTACNGAARRLLGIGADPVGRPLAPGLFGSSARRIEAAVGSAASGDTARLMVEPAAALAAPQVEAFVAPLEGGIAIVLRTPASEVHRAAAEFAARMACATRICGKVGHDLNNTLAAVLGYAELVDEQAPDDSLAHQQLACLIEAVERAAAFNADLLTMASREVVAPSRVDLSVFVPAFSAPLQAAAGHNVRLDIDVGASPLYVRIDPSRLGRVLIALVANAGAAMPEGGSARVTVERRLVEETVIERTGRLEPGAYAEIAVSDTGIGLAPEVEAHLFEPFFTTRTDDKSAGRGLAIVFGIVRQAHGVVTAEGAPGRGSTFRVYLPELEERGSGGR